MQENNDWIIPLLDCVVCVGDGGREKGEKKERD
jgi:hypothetical protein